MDIVTINGTNRSEIGKKASRAARREGQVPCVIYGGNEIMHFTSHELAFRDLVYSPDFKIAEIAIDGTTHKCILKDMQFHPVTDRITHLDFVKLDESRKVVVEIPIRFKGNAPGVKVGGKLTPSVRRAKVKTLPSRLTEALYVDISELDLGGAVRIRDIEIPEGMEMMNNSSIPVATIEIPRALRSATSAAEEAPTAE